MSCIQPVHLSIVWVGGGLEGFGWAVKSWEVRAGGSGGGIGGGGVGGRRLSQAYCGLCIHFDSWDRHVKTPWIN
jgi:hypothetical protein